MQIIKSIFTFFANFNLNLFEFYYKMQLPDINKDQISDILAFISLIALLLSVNYLTWMELKILIGLKLIISSISLFALSFIIKKFIQ